MNIAWKSQKNPENVIAAKEFELTESLILNAEYDHQIENIKGKLIDKEDNHDFSKWNELKKSNTESRNR